MLTSGRLVSKKPGMKGYELGSLHLTNLIDNKAIYTKKGGEGGSINNIKHYYTSNSLSNV